MNNYKRTVKACYVGYIVQAIVNNLLPLFFVIFRTEYGIDNSLLGSLILLNFMIQLIVDLLAAKYGHRLGYRKAMISAHICAALGLVSVTVLPMLLPDTFIALCLSTLLFAVGGGLIEVMVSPLMDSIESDSKSASMSLLHSFYCWGQVLVVAVSTLFLSAVGSKYWYVLPVSWALIPFLNVFPFIKAPFPEMISEKKRMPVKSLIKKPKFILLILMMVSAGAFELSISQWASYFAEEGLGVSKTMGDLLGPCLFAVFMGISRIIYGIKGSRMNLESSMAFCAGLGIICYLLAALSPNSYIALLGCAVCGFSVGLMWPGTLSLAGKSFKSGGTAMFGILALSGDLGCSLGPWITGMVSSAAEKSEAFSNFSSRMGFTPEQAGIKLGLLCGTVFPLIALICVLKEKRTRSEKQ